MSMATQPRTLPSSLRNAWARTPVRCRLGRLRYQDRNGQFHAQSPEWWQRLDSGPSDAPTTTAW